MKDTLLVVAFALLLLVGAVAQMMDWLYAPYVFAAGTLLAGIASLLQAHCFAGDKRLQRIGRIHFLNNLMLCLATYCMFTHSNSWVVFLLIYALVTLFLSYRVSGK